MKKITKLLLLNLFFITILTKANDLDFRKMVYNPLLEMLQENKLLTLENLNSLAEIFDDLEQFTEEKFIVLKTENHQLCLENKNSDQKACIDKLPLIQLLLWILRQTDIEKKEAVRVYLNTLKTTNLPPATLKYSTKYGMETFAWDLKIDRYFETNGTFTTPKK